MSKPAMQNGKKFVYTSVAGFAVSVITSPFLPELVSLAIPTLTAMIGYALFRKNGKSAIAEATPPTVSVPAPTAQPGPSIVQNIQSIESEPPVQKEQSVFAQTVMSYMKDIEAKVIEENKQDNLDDEIKQKVVSIVGRLEAIIPYIEEFSLKDLQHMVNRLVTVDLNAVMVPFLRLPTNMKLQNRRKVLNGINEINAKMEFLQNNIHEKDLREMERGLALISQRYNNGSLDKNI